MAIAEGRPDAAALLDRLYRAPLLRFCAGYVGPDLAEDAVQEVMLKILRARAAPEGLRAWIYTIARNHCLNLLRGARRRPDRGHLPSDLEVARTVTGQLTRMVRQERLDALARMVASLPEDLREILRLRYGEGLSRAEIGRVLDLTEREVKTRLFRASRRLREMAAGDPG